MFSRDHLLQVVGQPILITHRRHRRWVPSTAMRIPRPPSPPPLSLPQDSDDLLNSSSQPPLCTPVDQPVQHTDSVTASPIRTHAKRRRTNLNPVPPLELHPSLPLNSRHNQRFHLSRPHLAAMSFNDDDSQPANSQSFSQRDLPDMSQDTLALFPNVVRDLHRRRHSNPPAPPSRTACNLQSSDDAPPKPTGVNKDPFAGVARASMLSTLSGSEALCNPFLNNNASLRTCRNPPPSTPAFETLRKVPNASESCQDLGAEMSIEYAVGTTARPHKSRKLITSRPAYRKLDEEKLLKLLLVSSSQGRKLSLDFAVRGPAGKGAFSEVLKATHRLDGTTYAVKKNLAPLVSNQARRDAIQEVFALSALQGHPNIIRYHDAWFEEKGRFLLIQTEFISAGSLYSLFVEQRRPMNAEELFYLAADISHALSHIHDRGIVHLDVKPDNIFQADRGLDRESYVIGDFGLACHKEGRDARSTEGDARYLCPEALQDTSLVALDSINSDGRAQTNATWDLRARDVFSLGVTLFELGSGVPLAKHSSEKYGSRESLSNMASEVGRTCGSAIIERIVRRCLEPDPAQRATADEIRSTCTAHGSLEAVAEKERQERRMKETEKRLEECKMYLRSLLKKGEAGREQFRRQHPKGSSLAHSHVMSR